MLTLWKVEFMKLKRSLVGWVLVFMLAVHLIADLSKTGSGEWDVFLQAVYMDLWIRPVVFTFLAGYLFVMDYEGRMQSLCFTYPFRRSEWFIAKMLVACALTGAVLVLSGLLDIVVGTLFLAEPLTWPILANQGQTLLFSWCLYLGLLPLGALMGIVTVTALRLAVAAIGVVVLEFPLVALFPGYFSWYPWLSPYLTMHDSGQNEALHVSETGLWVALSIMLLSLMLSWYLYVMKDPSDDGRSFSIRSSVKKVES
ncbi:ABC transporter permease [Aneurinibacillus aneurinilyticus]|uniref:ABC transporter permease n=1 Tax=Aneurinibacillus aneurinilyticus TaxID=1391 RepID=UPI0035260E30